MSQTPGPEPPVISPIADLTYRHYDGPLHSRTFRFWIVALAGTRQVIRKWWFWLLVLASFLPYVIIGFFFFLESRLGDEIQRTFLNAAPNAKYSTAFFQAFDWQMFWLMVIGLSVGAASIAADNKTNALQVYLAKPLTKTDYLLGKWMGVFSVVMAAALLPSLLLFAYCLLSFWSDGFVRQEPWLLLKIIAASAVTASGFASLFVGVSAWSRSPMMAGAFSAGLYFASGIVATILWAALYGRPSASPDIETAVLVQHASIGGVIKSMVWNIYHVTVRMPTPGRMFLPTQVPPPNLSIMLMAYLAIVLGGLAAARVRIRAVEVIKG